MRLSQLKPVFVLAFLGALILGILVSSSGQSAEAFGNFNPRYTQTLCNNVDWTKTALEDVIGDGSGGCTELTDVSDNPDVSTLFEIDSGELNFCCVITFSPEAATIAAGDTIGGMAVGDIVGAISSATTLGLTMGPCSPGSPVTVEFVFFNGALPNDPADPRASTNIIEIDSGLAENAVSAGVPDHNVPAFPEGVGNRWNPLVTAGVSGDNELAAGTSDFIQFYPEHLLNIFDPDFIPGVGDNADVGTAATNEKPLVPHARYVGLTIVAGDWIALEFVQFAPGDLAAYSAVAIQAQNPFSRLESSSLGWPSVTLLEDPSEVRVAPSAIGDFCSPLTTKTMFKGVVGGVDRYTNPSTAGTYASYYYDASLRDTDLDTYENAFDPCPYIANVQDGRATNSDGSDTDAIDSACDSNGPYPGTPCTTGAETACDDNDVDDDNFDNRQDNCPQVFNPTNADSEILQIIYPADGGPKGDGIGDACDLGDINSPVAVSPETGTDCDSGNTADDDGDGVINDGCPADGNAEFLTTGSACNDNVDDDGDDFMNDGCPAVGPGATVSNGFWFVDGIRTFECIGVGVTKTDADGDGICSTEDIDDDAGTGPTIGVGVAGFLGSPDVDGDGFGEWQETYTGTNGALACRTTGGAPLTGEEDAWPSDITDDGIVDGSDVIELAPPSFGSLWGDTNYTFRKDITADGILDGSDVIELAPPTFGEFNPAGAGC